MLPEGGGKKGFSMRRSIIVGFTVLLTVCGSALGQSYPTKPIRAIIPFGAGSATDIIPRIVFDRLSSQLGQPIIVETAVVRAVRSDRSWSRRPTPNGYTLLVNSSAHDYARDLSQSDL